MSRAIRSTFSSLREYLTPVSHVSNFQSTGEITPEEFVLAGDYLVDKFPTWSWEAASPGKQRNFLPPEKQFLVTRHVPCRQRASQMDADETEDGEWVVSEATDDKVQAKTVDLDDDQDNFDDLEEEDLEPAPNTGAGLDTSLDRSYNIYITYSTSYRVPKLYLSGFDSDGAPLPPKAMFDDIVGDYKQKTVTIEPAPFLDNLTLISIHPCRHANVMRLFLEKTSAKAATTSQADPDEMDDWEEVPNSLRVDQYLVIFLKFIAGVTPTIEHDFTMSAL